MANLVLADIVEDVRRGLNEITMSGEVPLVDADMEDLASSNFETNDIENRVNRAARYVAARVRARYLKDLMETLLPTALGTFQVLRLLGSRSKVNAIIAQRRSFTGDIKIEATGRAASDAFPAFTYEDFELQVRGDTVNPSDSTVAIIRVPANVTELDDRFREAVIQRTLVSCFTSLKMYDLAVTSQVRLGNSLKNYLLPIIKLGA